MIPRRELSRRDFIARVAYTMGLSLRALKRGLAMTATGLMVYGPQVAHAAYIPPIGIPAPPFGIDEVKPTIPSPWTTNLTSGNSPDGRNWYYVKEGGSNGSNGFPSSPRGTIPTGTGIVNAVIVMDNTTDFTLNSGAGANQVSTDWGGTSGAPCWMISVGPGNATIAVSGGGSFAMSGAYTIFDGINVKKLDNNSNFFMARDTAGDHLCYRNSTHTGIPLPESSGGCGGLSVVGDSTSSRLTFCVIYNCDFHDCGDVNTPADDDDHCIQLQEFCDDIWILNNLMHHGSGEGCQLTRTASGGPGGKDSWRRIYFGSNEVHTVKQTGFWNKGGSDIITSQNYIHDLNTSGSSSGAGIGGQYDFNTVWHLFNRIDHCTTGLHAASSGDGSGDPKIYCIGNLITNLDEEAVMDQTDSWSLGAAFAYWQGDEVHIIGNTVDTYTGGVFRNTSGTGTLVVENNIFSNRTLAAGKDVFKDNAGTLTVKNNLFTGSVRFDVGGTVTTSISSFQSADPTNRASNVSGSASFVGGGDYHIQTGSAAKDVGKVSTEYSTFSGLYSRSIDVDRDGVSRPQNSLWDIGAYEFVAGGGGGSSATGRKRFRF